MGTEYKEFIKEVPKFIRLIWIIGFIIGLSLISLAVWGFIKIIGKVT